MSPWAILKYDVAVWGGCVIVIIPAGAVCGMLKVLDDAAELPPEPDGWDCEGPFEPDAGG